jgi:Zn-dependent protease
MQREHGVRIGGPLPSRVLLHPSWIPASTLLVVHLSATVFAGYRLLTAVLLSLGATAALLVSLLWHELAHAFAARSERVTLTQPTLYPFGGVALGMQAPSPLAGALVALAGPIASGLLAATLYAASARLHGALAAFVWTVAAANGAVTLVNLLPAFPFDGGRIAQALLLWPIRDPHRAARTSARAGEATGALMIAVGLASFLKYLPTLRGAPGLWGIVVGVIVVRAARGARRASAVAAALDAPAGSWATPFAGRVLITDTIPDGQGLFAVADAGRLAGIAPASAAGTVARDAMVRWSSDIACHVSDPLKVALRRMAKAGADVIVVLDEGGVARGVLSSDGVGERLRGVM